jgi:uncharacterized protein (TIGR03066 family)
MRVLCSALAAFPLLTPLTRGAEGPEGAAKDKLVGVWEFVKGGGLPPGATAEFTRDGKLILTAKIDGKVQKVEGTYAVDGDSFTMTQKEGGKEVTQKLKFRRK